MTEGNVGDSQDLVERLILMVGRLEGQIDGLKERVSNLEATCAKGGAGSATGEANNDADAILTGLTPRQHATLQMIMNGKATNVIAERLGVTESTVKVHIRLMAKKCGVRLRRQIVAMLEPAFKKMGSQRYASISGGLPKNWDIKWGQGSEEYDYIVKHGPEDEAE